MQPQKPTHALLMFLLLASSRCYSATSSPYQLLHTAEEATPVQSTQGQFNQALLKAATEGNLPLLQECLANNADINTTTAPATEPRTGAGQPQ